MSTANAPRRGRVGRSAADIFNNPILVGTITILIVLVAVYLSYIAENGLPFVATYNINADVPNANELVKNADVRVGGARVGQVLSITPEPAGTDPLYPHPFARLKLALEQSLEPLPRDTRYQIRLASVLGGKYLEIIPGGSTAPGLPDGGTFTISTVPALNHAIPVVDLDTAFAVFGPKTQAGLRASLGELGSSVAGRGAQFNDSIYALNQLMGPLESLLTVLSAPSTNLGRFIAGAGATTGALAPVAPTITALLADGAVTFHALNISALGPTIDQLPATEALGTTVLTNAQPVLSDAASIAQSLKPAAALLPQATGDLDSILVASTPVLKMLPHTSVLLREALAAVNQLALDPAATQVFTVLGSQDLATLGSSAFVGLGAILRAVAPAQFACNVAGVWLRNFASALSEGSSSGSWLRFAPVLDLEEMFQVSTPSPDLHLNYYPIEDSSQCQAGNEGYAPGQLIGNPPKTSTVVDNTTPPPGVLALGEKAGLVP